MSECSAYKEAGEKKERHHDEGIVVGLRKEEKGGGDIGRKLVMSRLRGLVEEKHAQLRTKAQLMLALGEYLEGLSECR